MEAQIGLPFGETITEVKKNRIGFYIDSLSNAEEVNYIAREIFSEKGCTECEDVGIFYNDMGKLNGLDVPCSCFHSSDLWSFEGTLIVSSVANVAKASSIVNNLDLYYYYGWEKGANLSLKILAMMSQDVKFICNGEESCANFKRITGKQPSFTSENYKGIYKVIL